MNGAELKILKGRLILELGTLDQSSLKPGEMGSAGLLRLIGALDGPGGQGQRERAISTARALLRKDAEEGAPEFVETPADPMLGWDLSEQQTPSDARQKDQARRQRLLQAVAETDDDGAGAAAAEALSNLDNHDPDRRAEAEAAGDRLIELDAAEADEY